MDNEVDIRAIPVEQVRVLRSALLRPHMTPEQLVYFGDAAPDTLHAGAFVDGRLMAIASVCREPLPGEGDAGMWRLRGVATVPEAQGRGLGRALMQRCIDHAEGHGGTLLWCHARQSATGFYHLLGFAISGDAFEIPKTGPHFVMRRAIGGAAPDR